MNLIKKIGLTGVIMGLVLATTVSAADIPQELVPLAQELGCQNTAECAEKFDANIEQGITLAQKYKIYTPEQEKVASTFKTEVLERLRAVSQDNFEEEILVLANKILKEKPALAKTMGVTRQTVSAAETIVNAVKDAGMDIRTCQKSPEDLSREQLIACVKAGNDLSNKEKIVGDYIPKENVKAKEAAQMLDLENSLLTGEYVGLGKIGIKEAGQICLKSGSESITDCDQIAQRFFGAEGVKELQKARNQNAQIKEYYQQGMEKMELVTPEGQKIIGKGAIKNACDRAFEKSNLGLARACGNFAVKNGFATQNEIEDGLKIMETFSQKAQGTKFDDCRFNPESCREFLPDEFRSQFDSQSKIFKIMSESIGFDPSRCENTYDPDIGKRCLEGAKKALGQVEEIAKNSPEARRIVDEIRSHITEGERMTERQDEFNQVSNKGGMAGPGGCRGPEECFKYCGQATNSAECISFGAKSQIFDQNSVIQRFNTVNEKFNTPYPDPRFNQYPYPQPPNIDQGFNQYPYPQPPVGPSPECFAAISSGDFAKAKTACSSTTENYPRPTVETFPVCQYNAMPSPCGEGQMRQAASDAKGCMTYGACVVIENYQPTDINYPKPCPTGQYWNGRSCISNPIPEIRNVCPMMPTISFCGAGQEKYETYRSSECGIYYGCRDTTTNTSCPTDSYWDSYIKTCKPTGPYPTCSSSQWWDPATQSCKSSTTPTVGSCSYTTQYWKASNSTCQPRTNCYDTANPEYDSAECQGVRGMIAPTNSTCRAGYHYHSESGGFCINDQENYSGTCYNFADTSTITCPQQTYTPPTTCAMGQYWNGTACVTSSTTGQCPSGQYWYTPPSGGAGYCMSSNSTACSSGQYWNGTACVANTYTSEMSSACAQAGGTWNSSMMPPCQMPTTNTTCPSGQYWNGTSCVTSTPPPTTNTTCPSGQYWNGSACISNSTTDTTSMSTACAQAGGVWNASTSFCQMPTTTSSTTCPSEQYWNGSSCVTSSPPPSSPDPATMCAQSGGTWTGSACQMAKSISNQKAYYSYYQKQSSSLLAQVFGTFADLFK